MLKKTLYYFLSFSLTITSLKPHIALADEGMWLPMLIKRLNYEDMKKKGLRLTPEEIYSVNNSSIKDAIVNFGNFCTGEVISKDGLVLTNHHCGYDAIQYHSTIEKDYLTHGFWALNKSDELPTPGLTVTFLIRMEDVTQQVLNSIQPGLRTEARLNRIEKISDSIAKQSVLNTHYHAEVKSFFENNEFYLFIYETFKDIRLVGAPPNSIGKFGGDTDNWMWPRHTGDFSLFRIYCAPDGRPAEYSKDNVPYTPKYHLPISLKGIQKNDFTMVLGYPGSTQRYLCSEGVKLALEQSNPTRIAIREKKLSIMKQDMDRDPDVKLKYASKYAEISNYYKYFIGQNQGLKKLKVVERKIAEEAKFTDWVNSDERRKQLYGNILNEYKKVYEDYRRINRIYIYLEEACFGPDLLSFAWRTNNITTILKLSSSSEEKNAALEELKTIANNHFKNYNADTDKKIFIAMLQMYYDYLPESLYPSVFKEVKKKYKGDFNKYAQYVYSKSMWCSESRFRDFLANPNASLLEKDPAYIIINSIVDSFRENVGPFYSAVLTRLEKINNQYLHAILEMRKSDKLYPDANFTMRITYGSVQDCVPGDAIHYNYYTRLDGIMMKEDSTNEEFIVPAKLKQLYMQKDYGRYADRVNGHLPVCFITNNDITGGNSGSPVINGDGHLIGVAFDGNWEAMSGDIIFEPNLQRCIAVDIRYVLYIIDKFAGATHLINEMTIIE